MTAPLHDPPGALHDVARRVGLRMSEDAPAELDVGDEDVDDDEDLEDAAAETDDADDADDEDDDEDADDDAAVAFLAVSAADRAACATRILKRKD